jgi:hypothetical protein
MRARLPVRFGEKEIAARAMLLLAEPSRSDMIQFYQFGSDWAGTRRFGLSDRY